MCVCERERVCVCVREKERESVCVTLESKRAPQMEDLVSWCVILPVIHAKMQHPITITATAMVRSVDVVAEMSP